MRETGRSVLAVWSTSLVVGSGVTTYFVHGIVKHLKSEKLT